MDRVLDEKTLLRLRHRMLVHARCKQHKSPEDIAQEYVMRLLEGLHAHATISQAYVDIVRLEANARSKFFADQIAIHTPNRIHMQDSEDNDVHLVDTLPNPEPDLTTDEHIDFKHFMEHVSDGRMSEFIRLRIHGEAMKDIGTRYGLTESRVSQLLQAEVDRLHKLVEPPPPPRKKRKIWRDEPEAA
jgi:DNA-directed RNA polymerase specialized sigma24 family protein